MEPKNPTIIVGHYGSGKTEFVVNYALYLSRNGKTPVIADMDIVNPYFRVRELKTFFGEKGIRVISSNYENDFHLDSPALATRLQSCFQNKEQTSIIDVGGDPAGANVLARYSKLLKEGTYNMWVTVNANRPKTSSADEAAEYIDAIEKMSKLKINGLLNTTHMLRDTSREDILKGDSLVKKVSAMTGIQTIYTVMEERLIEEMNDLEVTGEIFPIKLLMRPDWME